MARPQSTDCGRRHTIWRVLCVLKRYFFLSWLTVPVLCVASVLCVYIVKLNTG